MQDFISHIEKALEEETIFKLTIAKPRLKNSELRSINFRPVRIKEEVVWSATYRHQTKDQVKNYNKRVLKSLIEDYLENQFLNADLYLPNHKISLLQSSKGKHKVLIKNETNRIAIESHNIEKKRIIPSNQNYLQDLGLASSNGKIYAQSQDKYKQINKYVELLSSLIQEDTSLSTIVDMGCGKGYLTFGLYDFLANEKQLNTNIVGVEIRQDLVDKCNDIAAKNKFSNLHFEIGSIDAYQMKPTDMVIALHACDIATDMAIAKGLESNAQYIVVAPCCHKQIRRAMHHTSSVLNPLLHHGILKERQAEMITDTIRALILESKGYTVKVFEFISSEHTGKNVMITAVKTNKVNEEAMSQISSLKAEFGILKHYLEGLI